MRRMQKQRSLKELGSSVKMSDPALWLLRQEYHQFKANLGKALPQKDLEARAPGVDSLVCRRRGRTVGDAVTKEDGPWNQTHEARSKLALQSIVRCHQQCTSC